MRQKLLLTLFNMLGDALISLSVSANQETIPSLDKNDLVGTWQALMGQRSPTLFHMEINATGDSYLVQVRRLLSSEVRDGVVRLRFEATQSKELREVMLYDVWIIGTGNALAIEAQLYNGKDPPAGPPSAEHYNITFIKGPWTRAVADASRTAEKRISDLAGVESGTGIEGVITAGPVPGGEDSLPLHNGTFIVENQKETVASFTTDHQGRFRVSLKPGHYSVWIMGKKNGPFGVDVAAGQMTKVKWRLDTGIR